VKADTLGIWSTGDKVPARGGMTGRPRTSRPLALRARRDASHWLQLDQPERINALLLDFLK
jgi:pimeloyl-ACP methyl ester carboxylesterase